jgi:hypothetical protein
VLWRGLARNSAQFSLALAPAVNLAPRLELWSQWPLTGWRTRRYDLTRAYPQSILMARLQKKKNTEEERLEECPQSILAIHE